MLRRKGPAYRRATKRQRAYYAAGMPARYWKSRRVLFSSLVAQRPHAKTYRASGTEQDDAFAALVARPDRNLVVAVGSSPNDDLAMAAAAKIAKAAIRKKLLVEYINLGSPGLWEKMADTQIPAVLVLHNLFVDATTARLQVARDWIDWGGDSLRLVVIAGGDPVVFFDTRLHTPFDVAFYSELVSPKRKTRKT